MGTIRNLMIRLGVDVDVEEGLSKSAALLDQAKTRFAIGAAGIGAVVGSELSKGFESAINTEAANDKLAAQMGLAGEDAATAGKIAGDLYADAYGDSIETVNEALGSVMRNISSMADASEDDLKNITASVLDVGKAFNQDIGEVSKTVGILMKTGLAKDAEEALDLITAGFQNGTDTGGDFLDTLSTSAINLKQFGLDGKTSIGIMTAAIDAGAPSAGIFAGALEELIGNASDGIETFDKLGLGGKEFASRLAGGGPEAAKALEQLITKMREIENPAERSAVMVELFGEEATAMQSAILGIDLTKASEEFSNVSGAADKMGVVLADNAQTKVLEMQRGFEHWMASMAETDGVIGTIGTAMMAFGPQAITLAGSVAMIVSAFGSLIASAAVASFNFIKSMGTMVVSATTATGTVIANLATQGAKWLWLGIQSLLHAAKVAAAWLIALGPIGLIIAAVIAVVALIVANWDKIKVVISAVWEWLKNATKVVWDWVLNAIKTAVGFLVNLFMSLPFVRLIAENWDKIKNGVVTAWNWIVDKIKFFINMIVLGFQVLGQLPGKVWNWFKEMGEGAIKKLGELIVFVKSLPGRITDALGNLGKLLWDKGKQLLEGLWNGLQSMIGWIKDRIMGFFSGLLPDWVKSALGIGSPSKVFAAFGRNSGLSFVDTFRSSLGGALGVASSLMGKVTGIMTNPLEANLAVAGGSTAYATPTPAYSDARTGAATTGAVVQISAVNVYFADDRNLYEKGQEFAAGLREYKSRGGEIPS